MDISILPEQIVGYASMVYPVLTCFVLQKMTTTVVFVSGSPYYMNLYSDLGRPITWISILISACVLFAHSFYLGRPIIWISILTSPYVLFTHSFNLHDILYSVMH